MDLGQRIKEARLAAGMTQEELAERLGVSRQTIFNWEKGRSAPDIGSAVKMSRLFGSSLDALLTGEEVLQHFEDRAVKRRRVCSEILKAGALIFPTGWILTALGHTKLGPPGLILGVLLLLLGWGMHLVVFDHNKRERILGSLGLAMMTGLAIAVLLGWFPERFWTSIVFLLIFHTSDLLITFAKVEFQNRTLERSRKPDISSILLVLILIIGFTVLPAGRKAQLTGMTVEGQPFGHKYLVAEVLYPEDGGQYADACVDLRQSMDLRIGWNGVDLETIGSMVYHPPSQGNPAKGVWELTPEDTPAQSYLLALEETGAVTLACYEGEALHWKWALTEYPYHASLTAKNPLHTSIRPIDWYPASYPPLEPYYSAQPTVADYAEIALWIQDPESQELTVYEEYYHNGQAETRTLTLSPNDHGVYEWKITTRHEGRVNQSVIYRIPHAGGEFRFVLACG